jgi:hypothetical protein
MPELLDGDSQWPRDQRIFQFSQTASLEDRAVDLRLGRFGRMTQLGPMKQFGDGKRSAERVSAGTKVARADSLKWSFELKNSTDLF